MEKGDFVKEIADINTDYPQWYTDVVLKTGLADYGPVKGTMVILEWICSRVWFRMTGV